MVVFPQNLPELPVTQAAGTNIALAQTDPATAPLITSTSMTPAAPRPTAASKSKPPPTPQPVSTSGLASTKQVFALPLRFRCRRLAPKVGAYLAAMSSAFASTTLTVEELALNEANNGTIAVRFQSDAAVAAAQMDVLFDSAVYVSSSAGAGTLPESYRVDSHLVEPGRLRVVVGAPNNPNLLNGALFQVPLTARSSFASSFPIRLANLKLSTAGSNAVNTQIAPSVGLLGLTNGQVVNGHNGIQFTIEANATKGSIARVEYYANGVKIGESDASPFSFFWRPPISGTFVLQVVASDTNGLQTSSRSISIVVDGAAAPQLGNISTRLRVETGENVLIGGFIITGNQPKQLIVRGMGPSLAAAGLTNALVDPELELFDGAGSAIRFNNNWQENANTQQIIASTLAPGNAAEAAILVSLDPGLYTAILRGVNQSTGVGLIELYDLELGADSKLANISTRGFVQTGDDVLIGGMIVLGGSPQKVIIRAIGPSLADAGVVGVLADPTLELHDSNGSVIAFNDNWRFDQEAEVIATTIPPTNDGESAIVAPLAPGNYTAVVRGVNGSSGVALVEVYALP